MQTTSRISPVRNPETQKAHRQEFFLQILLPIILFSLLLLGLGYLASASGTQNGINHTAVWAHISTIFMVIILIGTGVAILAILALVIYALGWLLSKLPQYSFIAQLYFQLYGKKIQTLADKTTSPVISIHSFWTALKSTYTKKPDQPEDAEK